MEAVTLFWGASKLLQMVTEALKLILNQNACGLETELVEKTTLLFAFF